MIEDNVGRYILSALFLPLHIIALVACLIIAPVAIVLLGVPLWIVLPILAAAEVGYLGFYGPSEHNQKRFEERDAAKKLAFDKSPKGAAQRQKKRFDELYNGLEPGLKRQFDDLHTRCSAFNDMSDQYNSSMIGGEQLMGVNKLLWVYLKLLHTKMVLGNFFKTLNTEELDRTEQDALRRLGDLPLDAFDPVLDKKRRSIEDTIQTVRDRRENIKRALDNLEFVNLEIDRIGVKLTGISEMAINRHDPSALTQDVDGITRSVEATEQAIGELNLFTGFTAVDDIAPDILSSRSDRMKTT